MVKLSLEQIEELKEQEKEADDSYSCQLLAEEVSQTGDKEWSKKLYKKALKLAIGCDDYVNIAESVVQEDYLDDKEWAKNIYKNAEELLGNYLDGSRIESPQTRADDSYDALLMAESIVQEDYLGDKEWARKLYKKAEEFIDDSFETSSGLYISIAESVVREDCLADKEWARKLYKKAEELASEAMEYDSLLHSIENNLEDEEWVGSIKKEYESLITRILIKGYYVKGWIADFYGENSKKIQEYCDDSDENIESLIGGPNDEEIIKEIIEDDYYDIYENHMDTNDNYAFPESKPIFDNRFKIFLLENGKLSEIKQENIQIENRVITIDEWKNNNKDEGAVAYAFGYFSDNEIEVSVDIITDKFDSSKLVLDVLENHFFKEVGLYISGLKYEDEWLDIDKIYDDFEGEYYGPEYFESK